MKYLLIISCSLCCLYGCLDAEVAPRPSPVDQGVEENFDARPPLVAPHTGSGYGSGYSGSAPSELTYDQYLETDLGDEESIDAGVESSDAD
mgnify:CR=1 FL=1